MGNWVRRVKSGYMRKGRVIFIRYEEEKARGAAMPSMEFLLTVEAKSPLSAGGNLLRGQALPSVRWWAIRWWKEGGKVGEGGGLGFLKGGERGGVDNGGSRVGLGWGEENEGGCHGE